MTKSFRTALFAATSLMSMPAFAAEVAAAAAPGFEDRNMIVVTARKREETLQNVPLAISVLGREMIEREGLRQVEDIARQVPGLTFDQGGFLNDTRPAIRGMQAERGRPSVAILLNGQDLSGENLSIAGGGASLNSALFDLERIEVVKGPQSTLYGRNAFGGAINYITKKPDFDLGGRVGAEVRMQVRDAFHRKPLDQQRGLGQVGEVMQQAAVGPARHRPGQPQGGDEARRPSEREAGGGEQHRREAALQQVARALALLPIDRVGHVIGPTARRDAQHRDALTLEREDLAADEAVADLRVLVDQVGDAQRMHRGLTHRETTLVWPVGRVSPSSRKSQAAGRSGRGTDLAPPSG